LFVVQKVVKDDRSLRGDLELEQAVETAVSCGGVKVLGWSRLVDVVRFDEVVLMICSCSLPLLFTMETVQSAGSGWSDEFVYAVVGVDGQSPAFYDHAVCMF
jgi:hypothetical protein